MNFFDISWLAVGLSVIANIIIGSIYFGPNTLFWTWWQALGNNEEDTADGRPQVWILLILSAFIQAWVLAVLIGHAVQLSTAPHWLMGLGASLLLWVGIVMPSALVNKLFPKHLKAWLLEQGCHLLNYISMGLIIGALS